MRLKVALLPVTGRDPVVDLVRAVAMLGVIAGHWLVTALVLRPDGLMVDSPLRWWPGLAPLSWVLQTLGLFFFAGGFAAARSRTGWWHKVWALAVPVAVVLAVWAVVVGGFAMSDVPRETVSTVIHVVTTPLWFLAVYLVLLALMPVVQWLDARLGAWAVLLLVLLAIGAEVGGVAQLNVLLAWWAPWQAGVVVARRGFLQWWWGLSLLAAGVVAYAVSVRFGGYPLSAVGGTGEARSNIAPPSPAALALAAAQVGLVLTVEPLARQVRGRVVRWINERALLLFLVHQSAMLTVTLIAAAFAVIPGLHTSPDNAVWPLYRLIWVPVFAIALLGWLAFLRVMLKAVPTLPRVRQSGP